MPQDQTVCPLAPHLVPILQPYELAIQRLHVNTFEAEALILRHGTGNASLDLALCRMV